MEWELILWLIALISNIALLGLLIYQIICLSDLEADYLNPYESSAKINSVISVEFILQGAFCALFLLTGDWYMFILTMPVVCYHVRLFLKQEHVVDVTEIFRALSAEKKFRIIKLTMYLCFCFLVIVSKLISNFINLLFQAWGVGLSFFYSRILDFYCCHRDVKGKRNTTSDCCNSEFSKVYDFRCF